jgi:FecR-like protein/glucodextranase-like protein
VAPPQSMSSDRRRHRTKDDILDWFTVSYRAIYLTVGGIALAVSLAAYYYYNQVLQPETPANARPAVTTTTARFRSIDGTVRVKPVGTFEWLPADARMVLRRGDLVRTGDGSAAEIDFFDGTVVHVRPDSLITIEETSEDPSTKRRRVAWHISSGEVNFQTARKNVPGSATEVSTPTLRTTAGELTDGGIRVAESGDSDVRVYRGTTEVVTKSGERVALASSEALKVDAVGRPGSKQPLPSIPALLAPSHQAEITYPDPTRASTLLVWRAVQGAAGYHVMLDYSAYFNRPLVDSKHTDTSVEVRGLDPGKYYWRVAAVDKEGVEGAFSDFARFTVSRRGGAGTGGGPPPPLSIESLEVRGNILQVKGRTEPGASVTVNSQRVDVATDGSFNEYILLDKPGKQTVAIRAIGLQGGTAEDRRSVVVTY